jgi:hypothetical protein
MNRLEGHMKTLEKIGGIGPQTAKNLVEHGFADVGAIAGAAVADLAAVPGFSVARAEKTIKAARALVAGGTTALSSGTEVEASPRQEADSSPIDAVEEEEKKGKRKNKKKAEKESKRKKDKKKEKDKADKKKRKKKK